MVATMRIETRGTVWLQRVIASEAVGFNCAGWRVQLLVPAQNAGGPQCDECRSPEQEPV